MSEWVELLVTNDETEAHIIKNILENEDIEVVIDSLKIRPYPVSIGKIGEIRVLVKNQYLEEAMGIIKIMTGEETQ